ncbi:MAG: hypothetical protein IJL74_04770 [Bacilli bacterium]|nr:hypothetical protein [Bacilli bacterium]
MKSEENLKQLKMALTEHKPLLIHIEDNYELILRWDTSISNYRGYSKKLNTEIGIWYMEYLLRIANGKEKGVSLKVYGD